MISETKSILSFPDLIVRQLIRIHYTCFTVFVQFILGLLGRVALSPTAQMIEAEFSSLYASNRLDMKKLWYIVSWQRIRGTQGRKLLWGLCMQMDRV